MKRLVLIALAVVLAAVALAGCSGPKEVTVYQGLGKAINFRVGPGKDEQGVQVYSFNCVMADATFDAAGKIVSLYVDVLEVLTPNYDGEGAPHFPGWPDTEGYNNFDHAAGTIAGKADTSPEAVAAAVEGWVTKRDRGDSYHMNPNNDWHKQMNYYQTLFTGKTVAEIEAWVAKFTSDRNGRPLDPQTTNEVDKAKVDKLTAAEKQTLVDVRAKATMSLNDAHGRIVEAIKDAYENRREVKVTIK